jgi:Right handed beta helix region
MKFSHHRRVAAVAAAASMIVAGVLVALPGIASASGSMFWVSNTVATVGGGGTSCASPGYSTVQAAVTAAESLTTATVLICPGTYAEQVQVTGNTHLTIRAARPSVGATLSLPATPVDSTTPCDTAPGTGSYQADQDGLAICGTHAGTTTISNLTFDYAWPSGTCYDSLYGILVGGGDTLKMSNSAIVGGGAQPINGCQGGIGIQVGMAWTTPNEVGHVVLTHDSISGYQKNGMTIDGRYSSARISYDTVEGAGPTTQTAQNGIQVSNGAKATISHTTVSGNECNVSVCGPNDFTQTQATGILFYGAAAGSSVTDCVISRNDEGFYGYSMSPTLEPSAEGTIKYTTFSHNRYEGAVLDQGHWLLASDHINNSQEAIYLYQYQGQSYGSRTVVAGTTLRRDHAALQIASDNAATGDFSGSILFRDTRINAPILSNASNYTVTVTP